MSLPLYTERLLIRGFQLADVSELAPLLAEPAVMRYSVRGVMSREACAEFVHACVDSLAFNGLAPLALIERATGQLIGFCGLSQENLDGVEEVIIGYRLGSAFWGRGLASEAAQAILEHGFQDLGVSNVVAIVQPENLASVKVLHKLGFEGYLHGQYHRKSVRIYRMTSQQWRARLC